MKENFKQYSVFLILKTFGIISNLLGTNLGIRFGKIVGNVFRIASKKRFNITLDNLSLAFPNLLKNEIEEIAIKSYHNLGITFVEVVQMKNWNKDFIKQKIHFENIEIIEKAIQKGKGVIFLSGHYSNWELLAFSAGIYIENDINVVILNQSSKYIDKYLNEIRTKEGNRVISMDRAARQIVSILSKGEIIALLVDQSATENKDIFVDFFNRPASTYEAPASLALKFNSTIIMGLSVRDQYYNYNVKLIEIDHSDLQNNKEGILELTKRHVKVLEDQIRERPDLWSWQHKRWKHNPPSNEL
ncbi:MAG: lysophospholipid acyltransferase family protein [Candidatus Kapabacteria bacterium]|nr:lysophospholipid acyltransferase family protein [Candidatus Kapabacteria bacterium]